MGYVKFPNVKRKIKMPKSSCLECYQGGEQGVLERARRAIKPALTKLDDPEIERLQSRLGLAGDELKGVRGDTTPLTPSLLRKIRRALGIKLDSFIGPIELSQELREKWSREHERSPYYVAAFDGGPVVSTEAVRAAETVVNSLSVEKYIRCRAIEEV